MGLFDSSSKSESETRGWVQPISWLREPTQRLLQRAEALSNESYDPYTDQRIAGLTPDELRAFDIVRGNVGVGQDQFDRGIASIEQAGQAWSPQAAEQYMNPYTDQVLDRYRREALQRYQDQRKSLGARSASLGALTSPEFLDTQDKRLIDTYWKSIGDVEATALSDAYNKAYGMFATDQNRLLGSGGEVARLAREKKALGLLDAESLNTIGDRQRAIDQANKDFAYQQFVEGRDFPYKQTQYMAGILSGVPQGKQYYQKSESETEDSPSLVSGIGQLASIGTGIATAGAGFAGVGGLGSAGGSTSPLFSSGGPMFFGSGGYAQPQNNSASTANQGINFSW